MVSLTMGHLIIKEVFWGSLGEGLFYGLKLVWHMGYKKVILELDSQVLVEMPNIGGDYNM